MKPTRTRVSTAALAVAALLATATHAAPPPVTRGAVIASTCYTCHGTHGVSTSGIPSIDYIQPAPMVDILKSYRSGQRASTIMGRHASGYTDEEIIEVANHLGNQKKRGN
jgi:sulfide dehydrogenase cytochrome subunit